MGSRSGSAQNPPQQPKERRHVPRCQRGISGSGTASSCAPPPSPQTTTHYCSAPKRGPDTSKSDLLIMDPVRHRQPQRCAAGNRLGGGLGFRTALGDGERPFFGRSLPPPATVAPMRRSAHLPCTRRVSWCYVGRYMAWRCGCGVPVLYLSCSSGGRGAGRGGGAVRARWCHGAGETCAGRGSGGLLGRG